MQVMVYLEVKNFRCASQVSGNFHTLTHGRIATLTKIPKTEDHQPSKLWNTHRIRCMGRLGAN